MSKFIIILMLGLFVSVVSLGQNNRGSKYQNFDGTCNIYLVDTLHFESPYIICSKKNQFYFLTSRKDLSLGDIHKPWEETDFFILCPYVGFGFWMPAELDPEDENMYREHPQKVQGKENRHFYEVKFQKAPTDYLLALIRGDALNYLKVYGVFDDVYKAIKFKNDKLYYKLLIPIWKGTEQNSYSLNSNK